MKLNLGPAELDLDRPRIMGVLNVTPDSFSDGGRFADRDEALRQAVSMVEDGADIVDVGGESTRPGADEVDEQRELDRVMPVIEAIVRETDVHVSIDTSKPAVMRAAVDAGAVLVNDVYALRRDGALEAAADLDVAVCLMHMLGEPRTMQASPSYDDVTADVMRFLKAARDRCVDAGIPAERIVVDPGFGFGKTVEHNLELLANLREFTALNAPLLVGLSRKSTLGNLTGRPAEQRQAAGLAAAVMAIERGASIVRTHDVGITLDAIRVAGAVMASERTL